MNEITARHQIRVVRTRSEIESLREFWNSCNPPRDADIDFFQFILDIYPQVQRPHIVVLYYGGLPIALLVGRLEASQVPVKLGYFALPVPELGVLQIVHGGWLGEISEQNARMLLESIMNSLAAGEADAASFHSPDVNSPLVKYARGLPSWFCADHLINPLAHRLCEIPEKAGSFLAGLPKKGRYNQRKRAESIACDFAESRIERFGSPADLDQLMRDAETIAAKSYQRGLGVGFSETPVIRSRLCFEASKGWLQGYILYLDGQPVALWIGSLRNGVFLSEYVSYDPAYAKYGPGLHLILSILEELQASSGRPVRLVDFGIGDATYKELLANLSRQESTVYIFAPRFKAVCINLLRTSIGKLNRLAQSLLGRSWLAGIKRRWRTGVSSQPFYRAPPS
ncbi:MULTISPECIES: GNAT family N-acetyltransferase [unclassified Bradyrhizobium]|uniref:GNAT family N-acetyltransferase n=1 Tax=unclassified Bradyrhizobium TaxID=2631580 RepID=UPI00339AAB5E